MIAGAIIIILFGLIQGAPAATVIWDASGVNPAAPTDGAGNWSTANANWSDGATDNVWVNGNNAIFGSGGAGGAIVVGSGIVVGNITLNTNYTFNSNPLTLTGNPTIRVAGSATIANIISGTGFTKEGPGTLLLNQSANNTYTGNTIINSGAIQPGSTGGRLYIPGNLVINTNGTFIAVSGNPGSGVFGNGVLVLNGQNPNGSNVFVNSGAWISAGTCVLANGGVITNGGGGISGTYAATNTDARSGAVWLTRHGFGVFNTIAKSTAGTVIISTRPNASATDGYIATLNAGALVFDYAYAANNAVKLKANSPLTFAGGTLVFSNFSSAISPSANNPGTGGTFFNSGASSLFSTNAGSGGGNLTMGAITRRTGATFNLVRPVGPGNIGSTNANVNGIVGGWNTFNLTDWTAGTTSWAALAAANYTTSTDPTTWAATNNVSLGASTSPSVPDLKSINSLRLSNTATVTLDGSLTLTSGGLLVTGSGATAITGGTLLGASGADLIVHQNASADLTISSTLADNGSATSLTKDGTGKLILTGTDNMTGTNFLNGGVVEVSDLAKLASGPLDMNGGTLRYTGPDTTSSRAITTRGLGPILDIVGGTKVTQSGVINGSGDVLGDFGGLTKIGAGTLELTASNYYNGETVLNNGVLSINGTNSYNPTVWDAGRVTVNGGTLSGTGMISGAVTIKNTGTISPGNSVGTLTLGSGLTLESGATSFFEEANSSTGDLLQIQGNLTIGANCTVAVNVLGGALDATTNTIITYTGTKTGSFNPVVVFNGSLNSSLSIDESTPGIIKLVASPNVAIIQQPTDTVASTNDPVSMPVTAVGQSPITYQWYFLGGNPNNAGTLLVDQTGPALTFANADGTNSGYYKVVVANGFNSVTSSPAALIVGNNCPTITASPANTTVIQGNNASFSVSTILGNPAPSFQWQTNGVDVTGATSSSLTLNNVQYAALNNASVSVIVSNVACIQTNTATLTVIVTPAITLQPTNLTVNAGDTAILYSGASGVPAPALQWFKNNVAIPGETSSTLTIANAQGSNIGSYKLIATNTAGIATSSSATLTVNSTALAATTFSPANGAIGVGYDTPLYVTLNGAISIVNSGKIRIYNATNSVTPVDTIDMSSNTVVISGGINLTNNIQPHSLFSGDAQVINYFPVIITGSTAAIYPHSGVMASNQTYYVTMENGIVADNMGAYFAGISDTNAWRFTTKPTGPANSTNLVVAADGSGDFITVQGAVDSILPGNAAYTVINIRNGNYVEIVNISGKNNVTFRGQSRTGTVVGYANNNNLTGTTAARMAFKVNSSDIKLENLTLTNGTPQGGSQAETLLIYNNGLRCVVDNCDIISRQDTILINANTSQGYFNNCKIVGNFDYVWGTGVGYFNDCVIHTITNTLSGTYNLTAARTLTSGTLSATTPWVNPNGTNYSAYGFTFVGCTLEADPGVTGITLAGVNGTAGGLDAWVNCLIDNNAYIPSAMLSNTYVFWQYNNTNIVGNTAISFANVQTIGVTNNDPRLLAATNATIWFSGWSPQLAPNILSDPTNQTVYSGDTATFTVNATGIPAPTYQWLQNGTNAPYATATSATLVIPNAQAADATTYSVIVSNSAGSVTSASATLTVITLVPPTLSGFSVLNDGNFQFSATGGNGQDYRAWASTNVALTPITSTWTQIGSGTFSGSPVSFTDLQATNFPQRFYLLTVP